MLIELSYSVIKFILRSTHLSLVSHHSLSDQKFLNFALICSIGIFRQLISLLINFAPLGVSKTIN